MDDLEVDQAAMMIWLRLRFAEDPIEAVRELDSREDAQEIVTMWSAKVPGIGNEIERYRQEIQEQEDSVFADLVELEQEPSDVEEEEPLV
jgi:hypothetical protein